MALRQARWRVAFLCALIFPGSSSYSGAATLRKVWEIDLRKSYQGDLDERGREMPLVGMEFSPDGEEIAAITRAAVVSGRREYVIWVARARSPEAPVKSFGAQAVFGPESNLKDFSWSPSGSALDAGGSVFNLASGARCSVPEFGAFLGEDEIIASTSTGYSAPESRFGIFDRGCRIKAEWVSPERWFLMDVSPERRVLFMEQPRMPHETLIVDPQDGRVLHRWQGADRPYGRFANSGRDICGIVATTRLSGTSVGCWDLDSGKVHGVFPENGGEPFAVSSRSSRIIVSNYRYFRGPIRDLDRNVFRDLVVWDFAAERAVVSWRPQFQAFGGDNYVDGRPPKRLDEMDKVAISPDGQFVVEGGNGVIRLYRIEP
jgi:hypothetical protein